MSNSVSSAVCSICGRLLNGNGNCVACNWCGRFDQRTAGKLRLVDLRRFRDRTTARRVRLGVGPRRDGGDYHATDLVLHRDVALKVINVPPPRLERKRCASVSCAKHGRRQPCVIRMWRVSITLAPRPRPIAAITRWSWSRERPWKHWLGEKVRWQWKRRSKLGSKWLAL